MSGEGDRYEQCRLRSGETWLTCLLAAGSVDVGYLVTLKDHPEPDRLWTVMEVGQPISQAFVHRVVLT